MALNTSVTSQSVPFGGRNYNFFSRGTDFTVCFWANSGDVTSSRVVVAAIGGGGADGWEVIQNNNQWTYQWFNNSTASTRPTASITHTANTWVHVTFEYRNADTTGLIYINGVNSVTNAETVGIRSGILTSIAAGFDPNSGFSWLGQLSMLRQFDGLLTPAEIQAEMYSPVPVCKRFAVTFDHQLSDNGLNDGRKLASERSFLANYVSTPTGTPPLSGDPPMAPQPRPLSTFLTESVEPLPFNLNPLDPSTPAVTSGTGLSPSSLTTAAFSPPQGSLLVALVAGGWSNGSTLSATISDSTGVLTWSNPATATGPASPNGGLAKIFYAWVPRAQTGMTVTVTYSGFGASSGGRLMDLLVFDGAAPNQSKGASNTAIYSTGQSGLVTLTPVFPGSMIVGVSDDTTSNHLWTPNAFTRSDSVFFDSTDVVTMVAWLSTAPTPSPPAALTVGGIWNGGSTAQNVASNNAAWEVTPLVAGQPVVILQSIVTSNYW